MKYAFRDRMQKLKERMAAATALGHGLLDCPPETQASIADTLLKHVHDRAARLDIFLAMDSQGIPPTRAVQQEFDREISEEKARRQRQAENARVARQEQAALRAWKANRQQRMMAHAANGNGNGANKNPPVSAADDDE